MGKTITLAVDTARDEPGKHVAAAVDVAKELGHARDEATVPHVHEFAVGKFDRQGERLLSDIVADLGRLGISATGMIREAQVGHVAPRSWRRPRSRAPGCWYSAQGVA